MSKEPPHILLITMDELRRDALSCHGATTIETPHLDALAAQSIQFENAYTASPLCLPSRCSILTGQYPHRSGAYSNFRPCALRPELPNLYNRLQAAGYHTAHVGKCHYTPAPYDQTRPDATLDLENVGDFYRSLGLDDLILQNGKHNSVWFWNDYSRELDAAGYLAAYRDATWNKENAKVFTFPGPDEWHPDAWVGRKACEYLEHSQRQKPLFLWASFSGPHYSFDPPASYLARVEIERLDLPLAYDHEWDDSSKTQHAGFHGVQGAARIAEGAHYAAGEASKNFSADYWRRLRQHYFANVALIDDWIGRILNAARAALGDNLVVVFTTDHGEMLGHHGLWGKNGCAYQDVMNIPLLAHFPGIGAGRSSARVMLPDLMPTLLDVAGAQVPGKLDGRDLRRSLNDGGHELIFCEADQFVAIFDGRYKYVHCPGKGRTHREFYNLEADPRELVNAVSRPEYAPEVQRLQSHIIDLLAAHALE